MGKGKGRKVTYWNERESPHYLTIHQPYPMNASMDIEADRMAFSYWIASCIGRENLLAFFHKPKSPSMLIIELSPTFTDFKTILGEHSWAKFLRKPSAQEKTMSSRVFHCTYSTTRDVEKYGWKRIDLKDEWFISKESIAKWHRINNVITYPYPPTSWCEPPKEDPTRENLCRPLPVKDFPPPPPKRPPPVGSPAWQRQRELDELMKRAGGRTGERTPSSPALSAPTPSDLPRNLAGWALDRAPNQGTLPRGLVPSPSPSPSPASPAPSKWNTGPPGLARSSSGTPPQSSGSKSGSGSDSGRSSGPPVTPIDAPARTASVATSARGGGDDEFDSDSDDVEFIGVPTAGNILQEAPPETEPKEAEPEWVVADWVVPQEAPAQTGPVFKCTTHLHGRCKPAICEEHREWERKNRFKIGGHAGGWGSRRGNPRAESAAADGWRTTGNASANGSQRGRTRDSPPHLADKHSGSGSGLDSNSDSDSDDASSEQSSRRPRRRNRKSPPASSLKAKPNFEPAEQRPAHLLNRGAPRPAPPAAPQPKFTPKPSTPDSGSVSSAPARPASLQKPAPAPPAHLRKGPPAASASESAPPPPKPVSLSTAVSQWRDGVRSGAPSEAGGDDGPAEDSWECASTGSSMWPGRVDSAKTHEKDNAWAAEENAGATKDVGQELPVVWGQTPTPSEHGDDAQSANGWDNASMGESQWGAVNPPAPKRNQVTPSWPAAAWGRSDAASVSGWSAVSKGEGQWPGIEPAEKDDDAVSVASTIGPGNAQRRAAAAGDAQGKGKGKGKNKNKNKNQNQNQNQNKPQAPVHAPLQNANGGRANGPGANRPPWNAQGTKAKGPAAKAAWTAQKPGTQAKNVTSPAQGKMSWADQMDAEDDSRSVASQGWSKVAWN